MAANHRLPLLAVPGSSDEIASSSGSVGGGGVGSGIASGGIASGGIASGSIASGSIASGGAEETLEPAACAERADGLMQVGDLAREAGKTVRAIHLYEELQLLRPAARSKGRYRLYGPEALVRIRWIGKLNEMGFSLTDIQTIVRDWEESNSAPRTMVKMRELYTKKLEETREHLRRTQALEHELRSTLDYLDTCEVCDPARLLSACTSCDLHDCKSHVPDLIAGFRAN